MRRRHAINRPLTAGILLLASCAIASEARHNARLRADLGGYRFHQPCSEVWPAALRVLADHGYELVGDDRPIVGQSTAGFLQVITGGGFATTRVDHELVAETMEDRGYLGPYNLRYRVEARATGGGTCQVRYTQLQRVKDSLDVNEFPDLDMDLQLVRRLDPAAAARFAETVRN